MHVFVSYLHEDKPVIHRLVKELRDRGIQVWLDREHIMPGQRWQHAIRRAISGGSYFLACFSSSYYRRDSSYINEELVLAIEELRRRPVDRTWFIPVLLDKCEVPYRSIGAGETLRDIQWVDLSEGWNEGIERLLEALHTEETEKTRSVGLGSAKHSESDKQKKHRGLLLSSLVLACCALLAFLPVRSGWKECRDPEHGFEKYQSEEAWYADSQWIGGNWTAERYCDEIKEKRQKQYPARIVELVDKKDDHRSEYTPFKHDYYRFQCWFKDSWDPLYKLARSGKCREQSVALWRLLKQKPDRFLLK